MKVMIDSNIIIDVLASHKRFFESSSALIKLCGIDVSGFIISTQLSKIYGVLRRGGIDDKSARKVLKIITENLLIVDVTANDATSALETNASDYDYSVLAVCAKRVKADFIVTRNAAGFLGTPVPVISPEEYIAKFNAHDA